MSMRAHRDPPFKKTFTINGEMKEVLVVISEIIGYDGQERTVYIRHSNGRERWFEYDANGKRIRTAGPVVAEERDERGNVMYEKRQGGSETWFEYDAEGRLAHKKQSDGSEEWHEYSESAHVIHRKRRSLTGYIGENGERVIKEKEDEKWWEYDAQGKLRCVRTPDGYVIETTAPDGGELRNAYFDWQTLREDESGKQIYGRRRTDGFEEWRDYDAAGRLIHHLSHDPEESESYERWYEYDGRGNEIHFKDSDGSERWRKFDEQDREIYSKDSDGKEYWTEFDARGGISHYKTSDGYEEWYEYSESGKEVHFRNPFGEEWREYNDDGKMVHYKNTDGEEIWYDYDANGNQVYEKHSDGWERWWDCDERGNRLHYTDTRGKEWWCEYEFRADGTLARETTYRLADCPAERKNPRDFINGVGENIRLSLRERLLYGTEKAKSCEAWKK